MQVLRERQKLYPMLSGPVIIVQLVLPFVLWFVWVMLPRLVPTLWAGSEGSSSQKIIASAVFWILAPLLPSVIVWRRCWKPAIMVGLIASLWIGMLHVGLMAEYLSRTYSLPG